MSEQQTAITPILIVGVNRNGTTWLGNIISQCFDIAAPRHPLHYGYCETEIYENAAYWGDIRPINRYIHFLDNYCPSDVFRLLEGNRDYFEEHPSESFYDFFVEIIEQYARSQGKDYWAMKISSLFFKDEDEFEKFEAVLKKRYPTIKYIVIQRDFDGYIRSYINMLGEARTRRNTWLKKRLSGISGALFYHYYYPRMYNILPEEDTLRIAYQDLKENFEQTVNDIANFIEYPKPPQPDANKRNVQNTSFTGGKVLKKSAFISVANFVFKYFRPLTWLGIELRYKFMKKPELPPLWWRLTKEERFKTQLKEELKETGQLRLLEYIDG